MAGGKPVVSTGMFECRKYEGVLIAESREEFAERSDEAIGLGRDENYGRALRDCALSNSWEARAGQILDALRELTARESAEVEPAVRAVQLAKVS